MDADPVVIDCGTAMCKIGMAGDDAPRSSFPTVTHPARICFRIRESYRVKIMEILGVSVGAWLALVTPESVLGVSHGVVEEFSSLRTQSPI